MGGLVHPPLYWSSTRCLRLIIGAAATPGRMWFWPPLRLRCGRERFLHVNPGFQVSQVKTSRLKKMDRNQMPFGFWTSDMISCRFLLATCVHQSWKGAMFRAAWVVLVFCSFQRKDIGASSHPINPVNVKKTSHRMFRYIHGVLNEVYLQNFLHGWTVNRETNLMSLFNPCCNSDATVPSVNY